MPKHEARAGLLRLLVLIVEPFVLDLHQMLPLIVQLGRNKRENAKRGKSAVTTSSLSQHHHRLWAQHCWQAAGNGGGTDSVYEICILKGREGRWRW